MALWRRPILPANLPLIELAAKGATPGKPRGSPDALRNLVFGLVFGPVRDLA
jgi:hypothetical protein